MAERYFIDLETLLRAALGEWEDRTLEPPADYSYDYPCGSCDATGVRGDEDCPACRGAGYLRPY